MHSKCIQCKKGPVRWWKNDYINLYDFKCTVCHYVWHDTGPGDPKFRGDKSRKKTVPRRKASRPKRRV